MNGILDGVLVGLAIGVACGWLVWFVLDAFAASRSGGCGSNGCGCKKHFSVVRNPSEALIRKE